MANEEHLELIKQGVDAWNRWRKEHADTRPDLKGARLSRMDLKGANLSEVDLRQADLSGAKLSVAKLRKADLYNARLIGADLTEADLVGAALIDTDLTGANLIRADLMHARLAETIVENADFNGCRTYGISAWNLRGVPRDQLDLIITRDDEPIVTIDNLEVAQFIYLLLNNQKIRHVIDTITSKVVLILGRFTEERKSVLEAIRGELRRNNLTPILFDFEKPASKDLTGTVETLARMARFIIADLTDPSSIPHELATIVPSLRTTPVLPIKVMGSTGYSMFEDWRRSYSWVLDTYEYADGDSLISNLPKVIAPAVRMAEELRRPR
jgi:uncharacterized protein YjbI with pentapeptide repeats